MSKRIIIIVIIIFSIAADVYTKSVAKIGEIKKDKLHSDVLGEDIDYLIYYPYGYNEKDEYNILYLLHGLWQKYDTMHQNTPIKKLLDNAIEDGVITPTIVVFPNAYNSWYADIEGGYQMKSAYMKDVFPFFEKKLNIKEDRRYHSIGGVSMGGNGTLIFSFAMPEYFGSGIVMSPAITPLGSAPHPAIRDIVFSMNEEGMPFRDSFYSYDPKMESFSQSKWDANSYHPFYNDYVKNKKDKYELNFFVTVGTLDAVTPPKYTRALISDFKRDQIGYYYLESKDGDHKWNFWSLSFARAIAYLGKYFFN